MFWAINNLNTSKSCFHTKGGILNIVELIFHVWFGQLLQTSPLLAIWAILVFPSFKVQVVGSIPIWGLSLWNLLVLPVSAWILSLFSDLSPLPRDAHSGLIVGACVDGWMDELATCSGCTGYSLRGGWDRHQPYCNPECWRGINRKLRRNRFKFCKAQLASFIAGVCCIVSSQ